jgi:hypothetical protein
MSDEQGGIRQKASDIANESITKARDIADESIAKARDIADESITKSGEIVEGAEQILRGDLKGGLAKILKAAGDITIGATEKGLEIAADGVDKVKKPTETQ